MQVRENEYSPPFDLPLKQVPRFKSSLQKYRGIQIGDELPEGCYLLKHDWAHSADSHRIKFKQHVGRIKLPTKKSQILEILPKIEIDHWSMLNYLFRVKFRINMDEMIRSKDTQDLIFLIFKAFLNEVAFFWGNLKKYQYQEVVSDLKQIRGRIDIIKTQENLFLGKANVACSYEEFTLNHPFNQVIRYALELIRPQISFQEPYRELLYDQFIQVWYDTSILTSRSFTVQEVERFEYNYINQHYYGVHQLCKLIIENGFATPQKDDFYLFGFLLNTWRLFEDFIETLFRSFLPRDIDFTAQETFILKNNPKEKSRPDFLLKTKGWWAICDAKYKLEPDSNDKDRMGTYYQNMKGKKYIGSDECPEKIYCVFILPSVEKEKQEPWVVDLGHYHAIYAPLNLRGPSLRNQENLEKNIYLILDIISHYSS